MQCIIRMINASIEMHPLNGLEIGKEMIECPAPLVLRKAAHRHPMHLFLSLNLNLNTSIDCILLNASH